MATLEAHLPGDVEHCSAIMLLHYTSCHVPSKVVHYLPHQRYESAEEGTDLSHKEQLVPELLSQWWRNK